MTDDCSEAERPVMNFTVIEGICVWSAAFADGTHQLDTIMEITTKNNCVTNVFMLSPISDQNIDTKTDLLEFSECCLRYLTTCLLDLAGRKLINNNTLNTMIAF
jgi:hypothetical protein